MTTQSAKFGKGLERLYGKLENKFAGVGYKQALHMSTSTPIKRLGDRTTAAQHALWTLKSIMSYATEGNLDQAHRDMSWLCRFMRRNGLNLKAA